MSQWERTDVRQRGSLSILIYNFLISACNDVICNRLILGRMVLCLCTYTRQFAENTLFRYSCSFSHDPRSCWFLGVPTDATRRDTTFLPDGVITDHPCTAPDTHLRYLSDLRFPIAPRYFYFPQLPRKWIKRKMSVCLSAPCKNIRAPAAVKSAGVIEFAKNHKISLRSSLRSHTALLLHLFHLFHLLTF